MDFAWIFLIIAAVGYLVLRYYPRKKKQSQPEAVGMDSLGFSPVEYPEAVLKKKVIQMHTKYEDQHLILHDVFELNTEPVAEPQAEPKAEHSAKSDWVYLFDIEDHAGKEPYVLAQDVIAIISSELNTPRINIIARPQSQGGALGGIVDRFVTRLADWEDNTQGLKRLSFEDYPKIDKRFYIFSPLVEQAKSFLTPERLDAISNLDEPYAIDMSIDTVTIHQTMPDKRIDRRLRIEQTLKDAYRLTSVLTTKTRS